jgi:hypothetical protein
VEIGKTYISTENVLYFLSIKLINNRQIRRTATGAIPGNTHCNFGEIEVGL